MKFTELLKRKEILRSLEENNYITPTDIQAKIMPIIIDGKDVLGQSQTGTGKTLAFSGPILENILENKVTQTLILAPTRELAIQIAADINKYSKYTKINVTCVYGSSSIEDQIRNLNKGSEIVIGTPGRVKDLIKRKKIKLTEIKFFVLDEADEMLSMGFQEELEFIFNSINNDKQVLLFSATMPRKVLEIAENYMSPEYEVVRALTDNKTAVNITQNYYVIQSRDRLEALARILDYYNLKRTIIFVKTKKNADELLSSLTTKGYSVNVIHGDITQAQRIKTLDMFKSGAFKYLIATDVAARGIHVDDVGMVINYNYPDSNEAYVHRIGRTGRAGKEGISVTLVSDRETSLIRSLEYYTKSTLTKKDLPTLNDIVPNRMDNVIDEIDCLKNSDSKRFDEYLNGLSEYEMKNILSNLLEAKLTDGLGSNFNLSVGRPKEKRRDDKNRILGDSVRVFVTIGRIDDINKKDLLEFIEKKANIKEGSCTGIEILDKFSFMNIKKEDFDKVMSKCHNTKLKNRIVRIEITKKSS